VVPAPPLPEQRRIAARLKGQLAAVEQARAQVQAQSDEAKKLPAAFLRDVFQSPEAQRWPRRCLHDVADVVNGFGFPEHLQGRIDLPFPFIKVSDMNAPGAELVVSRAANTVNEALLRELRGRTYPEGTVIFPKVGGALLTNKKRILGARASFDNNIMGAVPRSVSPDWLFQWLQTIDFRAMANTQALPSIRQSEVAALPIPLPPERTRQELIRWLQACQAEASRARAALTAQLADLSVLPNALLREAFGGRS
jgi:restriction endonuclease S subunit